MSSDPERQGADELGFELPAPAVISRRRGGLIAAGGAGLLLAALAVGYLPKYRRAEVLRAEAAEAGATARRVEVLTPKPLPGDRELALPGTVQPLEEAVIYPRASGYVKRWLVDLGSKVKEGELLLEIDTPELDAQVEQAKAQLAESQAAVVRDQAAVDFSKTSLDRYQRLTPSGVVSQQDLEQRRSQAGVDEANLGVAKAAVAAAEANLRRLLQDKAFARVAAPFSGRIVSRTAERGALVTAGTSSPLFKLQATDPVRIFVQVPQDVAPTVQTGVTVKVSVREYPGQPFEGTVARAAGSLDELTRTMTTEVRVPNPDNKLLPGMYVQVELALQTPHRLFEVPATALYTDSKGTRVAVVDAQGRVSMRRVVIERDTGTSLQVASGLEGNERVVKLANAELDDGSQVAPFEAAPAK